MVKIYPECPGPGQHFLGEIVNFKVETLIYQDFIEHV
jgi:hypothetical protein